MAKFCVTCYHHRERPTGTHECLRPEYVKPVNLVTGQREINFCSVMRDKACGVNGELWEAK